MYPADSSTAQIVDLIEKTESDELHDDVDDADIEIDTMAAFDSGIVYTLKDHNNYYILNDDDDDKEVVEKGYDDNKYLLY